MELSNDLFLRRLGSKLGGMLKIDKVTSIQSRGQFARICVELDLAKPLLPKIIARGILLNLEYECLHMICFRCGKYGHKEINCPENKEKVAGSGAVSNEGNEKGGGKPKTAVQQEQPMQPRAEVSKDPNNPTVEMNVEGGSKGAHDTEDGPWMIAQKKKQ